MLRAKKADFFALSEKYGVDPVIIRLLVNRGVKEEEMGRYLNPTLSQLHDPHLLKDSDKAAEILEDEIKKGTHIRIIGDYDVDGVNSTYILYRCLENAGASVSYAIPHRANDGYGINIRLIDQAKEEGAGLIITCDNGIAASGEIAHAKSLGLKVIVTDHHEVPFEENGGKRCEILPPADAIVNPKQALCPYPFKGICGAVVA
ncbi:MAG: DHH family phosphoesterase, partial [Eubacterium sp.]|nr:DHH family phosphoesterase [Eubacterium sp.]